MQYKKEVDSHVNEVDSYVEKANLASSLYVRHKVREAHQAVQKDNHNTLI